MKMKVHLTQRPQERIAVGVDGVCWASSLGEEAFSGIVSGPGDVGYSIGRLRTWLWRAYRMG